MDNPQTRRLEVRFVGSGSEYFRIWIVNLLLTLLTMGLYYPFAKVRKLRYFHGATEVGGHPMSFHADPWKMLRGYALVGAMLLAYSLATHFSPTGGVVAFVIVASLWPALWHSSLRFRMANTGWRGLRFRFTGSRAGAYKVMLPWAALVLVFIVISVVTAPEPGQKPGPQAAWLGVLPLVMLLFFPALLWALRGYQHAHYALGGEQSRFMVGVGAFYKIFGLAALMFIGVVAVVAMAVAVVLPAVFAGMRQGGASLGAGGVVMAVVLMMLAYVVILTLVGAFVGARLQNVVWGGTRSQHLGFESRLGIGALAKLTMKNWLLIVLTLGLYFPFAAVATARLRLQAVQVLCDTDPNVLVSVASHIDESAAGDAAGDLFGIDMGL